MGASHRGLLDAAPLAAGSTELRRLLHATQTLALSSFSMVHVVHDQLEAESGNSRATAVCSGSAEAVSDAVFLAAGGAWLLALPSSRGLLPPFASMRSAVLRSSGLVVLAMTAKQRASTALWPGCSDIRDHSTKERARGNFAPSRRINRVLKRTLYPSAAFIKGGALKRKGHTCCNPSPLLTPSRPPRRLRRLPAPPRPRPAGGWPRAASASPRSPRRGAARRAPTRSRGSRRASAPRRA